MSRQRSPLVEVPAVNASFPVLVETNGRAYPAPVAVTEVTTNESHAVDQHVVEPNDVETGIEDAARQVSEAATADAAQQVRVVGDFQGTGEAMELDLGDL